MGLKIIPREEKFFELFIEQAKNMLVGARQLSDLFDYYTNTEQKRMLIEKTESNGDEITHTIIEKLNTTFITPLDREDIHALTSALDDILDLIHATAQRLKIYHIESVTNESRVLVDIIVRCAEEIVELISMLDQMKHSREIKSRWIEINRLENEGDKASRTAIGALFEHEKDPIEIIKWKEIYEYLEKAIDKCEDTANIVEAIVLKNA